MTTQSRFSIDNIQFSRLELMEEKYLRGYISKKLYNLSDLDDAYQTTLMEAYRSRKNYRGDSTPRVWICGIANNIAIGFNKQHIRSKTVDSIDENSNETFKELQTNHSESMDHFSDPENNLHMDAMCTKVQTSIEKLDNDLKGVFSDAVIQGNSYQCVAEKYSIPIGTVKSRIAKVREHLRTAHFQM